MRPELDVVLDRGHGVATRSELIAAAGRHRVDEEIRQGHLVRVFPRTYARPWLADDHRIRGRAALASVGGDAVLSHVTALRVWCLPAPSCDQIHVTVSRTSRPRSDSSPIVVHRTRGKPPVAVVDGMAVLPRAHAIVTSWPMLQASAQRAPLILASRERLVTPAQASAALSQTPRVRGRTELRALIDAIDAGCQSELELWGYLSVFDVPGLRGAERQRALRVNGRTYFLDTAYEKERLAVELDGRAYHASPKQWERDIRRDLALATAGWQTIRLSHRRLTTDVDGCRRDVLRVLSARRRLGIGA